MPKASQFLTMSVRFHKQLILGKSVFFMQMPRIGMSVLFSAHSLLICGLGSGWALGFWAGPEIYNYSFIVSFCTIWHRLLRWPPGVYSVKFAHSLQFDWAGPMQTSISLGEAIIRQNTHDQTYQASKKHWMSARNTFCCSDNYGDAIDCSSRSQICRFRRLEVTHSYPAVECLHSQRSRVKVDSQ
jgi:hypothetical protein